MSAAIRFLAVVLVGWAGVRAATLGVLPGSALFSLAPTPAKALPASAQLFPALEPAVSFDSPIYAVPAAPADMGIAPAWRAQPIAIPYYVPVAPRQSFASAPAPAFTQSPALYPSIPGLEHWASTSNFRAQHVMLAASTPAATPSLAPPAPARLDRLQLTAWTLLRGRQTGFSGPASLASGGSLGGSQAGARLTYRFTREIAASLRTTSAVGTSQSEVAAGIRVTPFRSIPFSVTAERRQPIGHYGSRPNFAVFAEAGLYDQSLWGFRLDGYAQGGVVGVRDRALFADGSFAFTRPIHDKFSAGFAVWGGVQPGVYRVDAGPRVSYRLRPNMRLHVDWRQRLAGRALPGSGPALTIAGDF